MTMTDSGLYSIGHNDRIARQYFCIGRDSHMEQSSFRHQQRGHYRGGLGGPRLQSRLGFHGRTMEGSSQRQNPHGREFRREDARINRDQQRARGGILNQTGWYRIKIPHGKKYDEKWLVAELQNICSVPFTPIQYRVNYKSVTFYVDCWKSARALQRCSHKITASNGYKVVVYVSPSNRPNLLLSDVKPEQLEHLKECMAKRFDSSQQALDLNRICTDADLLSQNMKVIFNRKTSTGAVIKVIEDNIPELSCLNLSNNHIGRLDGLSKLVLQVPHLKALNLSHNNLKSVCELDRLQGLKLVELWLLGNPLCDKYNDKSSYISAVRKRFPLLMNLDGIDLQAPIGFDVKTPTTIPPCKGSCFSSDDAKALILRFLEDYYGVYDSGNRESLLGAYHPDASFSLTTFNTTNDPSRLREYHEYSRNLKRIKDSTKRFHLLKHKQLNAVAFLNTLPKTQHDPASFTVDVDACTNSLLSFTVSGVFREVADGQSPKSTMAFSRVFITVPAENSGLCITNDLLSIRMATTEQICKAFVAPTASSGSEPPLTSLQREKLHVFSQKSDMNLEWSQKCLQDNNWDFNRAAQIFTQLKKEGKVPNVAFLK